MSDASLTFHAVSAVMKEVLRSAQRIAPSEATVLVTGETGTGKEVMARYIHQHSARAHRPFVAMNCAAIPETLIESELFGHARGAFTGAVQARKGRLAIADGGTLFLDEIGELPLSLQVKLLRVLQERVYEPVGSCESVQANFRLVAATNRDLAHEVEVGRFRRDLYYRLMVCPIELPPLRERPGDISQLFLHFWRAREPLRPVSADLLEALERYPFPGNVRELENLVERLSVCAEGAVVTRADLPAQLKARSLALREGGPPPSPSAPAWDLAAARPFPSPPPPHFSPPAPSAPPAAVLPALPGPASDPVFSPVTPAASAPVQPGALAADSIFSPATPAFSPEVPAVLLPPRASPPRAEAAFPPPPASAPAGAPALTPPRAGSRLDLPSLLRQLEDAYIDAALEASGGNKKAAADMLGLQRTTLVEKLRRRGRSAGEAPGGLQESAA